MLMVKLKDLFTSEKSLLCGDFDLAQIQQNITDYRNDRILKMSQAVPNFATDVKEEEKLIILIDIVGFSKDTTRNQVYKIYLFQRYLMGHVFSNKLSFNEKIKINHFVPTGDGCYIVAEKCSPEAALDFLITVISGFKEIKTEESGALALRASALFGKVVPFLDMARHLNYIGEGMNEAARILSGGQKILEDTFIKDHLNLGGGLLKTVMNNEAILANGKEKLEAEAKLFSRNSLYLGDSLAENLEAYKEACTKIYSFPSVADKHGMKRNVTVLQGIN